MRSVYSIIAAVLAILLAGCPRSDDGVKKQNDSSRTGASSAAKKKPSRYQVDNLDSTSVVIRVASVPITQQDYEDWYRLRVKMYCEANRVSARSKDDRVDRVKHDSRNRAWNELIRREIMRQEAKRLGVKAAPGKVVALQKRFMRQIKHRDEDFSAVDSIFGEKDARLVRAYLESVALEDACLDASATNDISRVTDEELDEKIKGIKEWNARADASNAVQIARAKAAKAEILGGKYFYDVTTNCADFAKEDGNEWQVVELGDFDADDPLAKWLITAEQGDISDPIDLEDGLAIVGLKFKYPDDDVNEGEEPVMQYDLVRCSFYAFEKYEEIDDREQFRRDLLIEKRNAAMRALGERLVAETPVEFPYGEDIFKENKGKPKQKPKKVSGEKPAKAPSVKREREEQK